MTTRRRMPGPATEWRVGARRARTFQQPLDPLADRGIWCRSPAAVPFVQIRAAANACSLTEA